MLNNQLAPRPIRSKEPTTHLSPLLLLLLRLPPIQQSQNISIRIQPRQRTMPVKIPRIMAIKVASEVLVSTVQSTLTSALPAHLIDTRTDALALIRVEAIIRHVFIRAGGPGEAVAVLAAAAGQQRAFIERVAEVGDAGVLVEDLAVEGDVVRRWAAVERGAGYGDGFADGGGYGGEDGDGGFGGVGVVEGGVDLG